ncbi:MAG: cadherin repeat domain-containing protein [Tunicatimonas sp.]
MRNYVSAFLSFVLATILLMGCTKEDDLAPAEIAIAPFTKTTSENPAPGASLGTLKVTASRGPITYVLSEEVPAGALSINAATGELTVKDSAKFDFETNVTIKAKGTATVDGMGTSAPITITITRAKG